MHKFLIAWLVLVGLVELSAQQTGYASFYADKFVGRKTANGEIYSHSAPTAAHKKLPFGTALRVTNVKNNKSVLVKVNDRGPHSRRFIIDLSKDAAKALDIFDGSQTVTLEVLGNTADSTIVIPDLAQQINPSDSLQLSARIADSDTTKLPAEANKVVTPEEIRGAAAVGTIKNLYQVLPSVASKSDFGIKLGTFESFHKLNVQLTKLRSSDQKLALVFLSKSRKKNEYTLILGPFASKVEAKKHPKAGKSNIISLKTLTKI